MQRIVMLLTAVTVFFPGGALASYTSREEVLQLYQESLFQETGICDLESAKKSYLALIKKYKDYRDIIAVVMYRLGIIHEKNGEYAKAGEYFTDIINEYADQENTVGQAGAKLAELAAAIKQKPAAAIDNRSEPESSVTDNKSKSGRIAPGLAPEAAGAPKQEKAAGAMIGKIGVGVNANEDAMLGIHVRFRLADNIRLETKSLVKAADNVTIGGRVYSWLPPLSSAVCLLPYTGMEYAWTAGGETGKGYALGGFAGGEYNFFSGFNLGADLGYYYEKHENLQINLGIKFNAYITAYF